MADISSIKLPSGNTYDVKDILGRQSIPYGIVTSDSTTVFTATVDGVTQLSNGVCCLIRNNNKQTSASGWTLNVNDLGAKPVYNNMADATRDTTIFNKVYTMLFVYDEDRVDGGCWICYRGYNSDNNTIGYQLRTNSTVMNVSDTARYYKLYFMSADNTMWVPASVNSTNNATAARPVNQRPINPFGRIVYTSANTNYTAGSNLAATTIWDQYALSLGYSFNRTGAALTMTVEAPVYVKCAPQADGSAIMDATTPIVQALPSTADGKIYIYLGVAYNATNIELVPHHPVYYHDGTAIRIWTGASGSSSVAWSDITGKPTFATVATSGSYNDLSDKPTIPSAVTESTVAGWGFTKNTGTYSKPSGGIPKTDLASAVQTSLGKADTALQSYTETDPTVPSWAKASSKPTYTASEVGALPDTTAIPTNTSDLTNDSGFITGMTVLSYGNSTWADFEAAYNANKVVYCRASSNADPASGSQTRLAFMAYVNNATTPTNVEFQYYRSVSTHTASQQGDQVFVYKLDKTSGWSVTIREASVKVVAGNGLGGTYSNGTMTLAVSGAIPSDVTATTQTSTDNSTKIATTAFVKTAIDNAGLWEQGVDANDQPVPGAIKAKDYTYDGTTYTNTAPDRGAFVAGGGNTATGVYAVIAGCNNTANDYSNVFGYNNTAAGGGGSTLVGYQNQATSGTYGTAFGSGNTISHNNTVAMGMNNTASNYQAVALGYQNTSSGYASGTLGNRNTASGSYGIALGYGNTASGYASVAVGRDNISSGQSSYAEGRQTTASGSYSHAEGAVTQAIAKNNHVFGTYNVPDSGFTAATERGTYIEIVGNGSDAQNLSNARTLDWNGNEWVAGNITAGGEVTDGNGNVLSAKAKAVSYTASGAIANFTDGTGDMPVVDLVANIEPAQNLPYGDPYPAGSGKNKLGFLQDVDATVNGVRLTYSAESGAFNISGTNTNTTSHLLYRWYKSENKAQFPDFEVGKTFTLFCDNTTIQNMYMQFTYTNTSNTASPMGYMNTSTGKTTFTVPDNFTALREFQLYVSGSATELNGTFHIWVEEGTVSSSSFAPYSNVCPITGWTGCNVTRTGKNLLSVQPTLQTNQAQLISDLGRNTTGQTFTITFDFNNVDYQFASSALIDFREEDGTHHYLTPGNFSNGQTTLANATKPASGRYSYTGSYTFRYVYSYFMSSSYGKWTGAINNAQLELGSTATTYDPYQGTTFTIDWTTEAGTVYGGTIDVATGLLTVTHGILDLGTKTYTKGNRNTDNTGYIFYFRDVTNIANKGDAVCSALKTVTNPANWEALPVNSCNAASGSYMIFCADYADAASFKTAMDGVQLVYTMATSQTYQLSGQQLATLLGTNNVWADTGNTTVRYIDVDSDLSDYFVEKATYKSGQLLQDKNLAYVESGTRASRAYSVNNYFINADGVLCRITASVSSGGTLVSGTNYTAVTGGLAHEFVTALGDVETLLASI